MAKTQHQQLPIYMQIAELLIRDIGAGRLLDGERLPPERQMSVKLGVSVGTLRKALDDLESKGLLVRIQGSGNYVRTSNDVTGIYAMFRLELPEGGGLPRAQALDIRVMDKPADLPKFGTSEQGTRVRRLRRLNETIIAVEEIWLDASMGQIQKNAQIESLYRYYQRHLGFWIRRAEDRVGIGTVPEWAPPDFPKPAGATVGYIERYSWADDQTPIEFSRTWFDPDQSVYVQRLK